MKSSHKIMILPHGRQIIATSGERLMEALIDASIFVRSDCGGKGRCGKCQINRITATGKRERITSCNTGITEDLTIEIPESTILSSRILNKPPVSFPPSFTIKETAISADERYGIAVDLGTTTIAIYLCCRQERRILASIAAKNPQAIYGDDVMNRIGAIEGDSCDLGHMQKLAISTMEWGISNLIDSQSLKKNDISQMVVVGNPTMIHILLGEDPHAIGVSPYQPAFYETRITDTGLMGFTFGNVPLLTLPNVSGFIGGDILAAALATDLENQPDGTLLVDLGTNGELLFKAGDRLFATSCATGPAFEGASLSCGIQAIPGAINKVEIPERCGFPLYRVIESQQLNPQGICGSGVISAIAELWTKKIITAGGAFITDSGILPLQKDANNIPQYHFVNVIDIDNIPSIYLSQQDIRSVQLGKAALRTGIHFLTKTAGYTKPEKIIIAGAFGSYVDKKDMVTIGMLPEIDLEKIEIAGNSAGAGAVMILCENDYFAKSTRLAEKITSVDLATDLGFQEAFVNNLSLPACE